MKYASIFSSLVLALLLIGCSSSQPTTTESSVTAQSDTTIQTDTTDTDTVRADTVRTADPSKEAQGAPTDSTTQDESMTRSEVPNDWFHLSREQARVPGLATQTAFETVLSDRTPRDTVTVAIIDSGIDVGHEDLTSKTWTNADEKPGNNKDDDDNGYVDDVQGWNFIGGPGGQNVNQDTYELTRIYVRLQKRFANVDSADVPPDERDAYRRFRTIKEKFQTEREQAKQELAKIRKVRDAVNFAQKMLSDHLETDSITKEAVKTLSPTDQKVKQARAILLHFYQRDLTPEDIYEVYDRQQDKIEYNYNSDFNPRSIVGDDYSDKSERIYGNNDVTGPDAEHGTHVGGIIGAERENGIGIDGVADGVRIMPVRAVPNGDERDKDVANAIRYAVDNGADVINMSFGKSYSPHKEVVDAAVRYADSLGVLMVHAAGNDGENVDSTDNYPTRQYLDGGEANLWIEVGASSWEKEPNLAASFSNYGNETVDVFAPGKSIYSTVPGNKYDHNRGTSMAAPMVSGVAALIMAYYPDLTSAQVRDVILETATSYEDVEVTRPGGSKTVPFGQLSRTGGIVNAHDALKRAEEISQ